MIFHGRSRELGRLRTALDDPEASVHRVTGVRGVGKSALVRRATDDLRTVVHTAPPLPDPDQRAALASTLRRGLGDATEGLPADPNWEQLAEALVAAALEGGGPTVLVVDDAHRLAEARARFLAPLRSALERARSEARALHVVLVGAAAGLPNDEALGELAGERIEVGPLPFRAALPLLPGTDPEDLLASYTVFGGLPWALARLDPAQTLPTNARRELLGEEGALRTWPLELVEHDVQTPSRYVSILRALAHGEADWGRVHEGVRDLSGSGQVAPYLRRLEELGLVEVRRSLDASPRGRSRRYRIADPLVAFWYRFVLEERLVADPDPNGDSFTDVVRPTLDAHSASVFAQVCRDYMSHDAIELLESNARECGSLWGEGYDIPVAGTLASGAVFYGVCLWEPPAAAAEPLDRLDAEVRETRYGFGRERRLRVLFAGHEPSAALSRAVARRRDALLVGPDELAGV